MQLKNKHKTWIEISKKALYHNIGVFRKTVGKNVKIAAVVKANAYGHGLAEIVSLLDRKVGFFAVDRIEDAFYIQSTGSKTPVLVLGFIRLANLKEIVEKEISFVAYNLETLRKIVELDLDKKAKVHLKIETGLNRQGVQQKSMKKVLSYLEKHKDKIYLEGISTHFANIEDTLDPTYAMKQLAVFKNAVKEIKKSGFNPPFIHASASAGTLLYPETHFTMVRIGFGIYGWWMSTETRVMLLSKNPKLDLKPVMTWKSVIAQIKKINTGEAVGYGLTWFAPRRTKIAVIPVGYSEGYDRKLSNIGRVIVNGKHAPIIGRIAMNMFVVDITDAGNVKLEDEVVLLGNKSGLKISADEIAKKIGTINYEVLSRINPDIPKIIV